jgi:hypothetical protein
LTLGPKYSPQHPILEHPQPQFLRHFDRSSFTPIQTTGKIIVLYILNFIYLCMRAFKRVFVFRADFPMPISKFNLKNLFYAHKALTSKSR